MSENFPDGYVKIDQDASGSYICAGFYNPQTKDYVRTLVRDYEYADGSRDDDLLYDMPIDHAMAKQHGHENGRIYQNDTVMVVKGRKIPIGTVGVVAKIAPCYDRYGRWRCNYVYFMDRTRTNIENCILMSSEN